MIVINKDGKAYEAHALYAVAEFKKPAKELEVRKAVDRSIEALTKEVINKLKVETKEDDDHLSFTISVTLLTPVE